MITAEGRELTLSFVSVTEGTFLFKFVALFPGLVSRLHTTQETLYWQVWLFSSTPSHLWYNNLSVTGKWHSLTVAWHEETNWFSAVCWSVSINLPMLREQTINLCSHTSFPGSRDPHTTFVFIQFNDVKMSCKDECGSCKQRGRSIRHRRLMGFYHAEMKPWQISKRGEHL